MRFKNKWYLLVRVGLLICSWTGTAFAIPTYSGFYVFGDSLSDVGNLYALTKGTVPVSPPYSKGRFSNGAVWVQDLAASLGLGQVTPSLKGGQDFAYGDAQTGPTLAHPGNSILDKAIDLPAQLSAYQKAVPNPQPDALYALWIGSNDVDALITGLLDRSHSLSSSDIKTDINQAVGNIGSVVDSLAKDDMKHLLALNVPDLSKDPRAIAAAKNVDPRDPAAVLADIQTLTETFNSAFQQELLTLAQRDGFHLSFVNTYVALDNIVADPRKYGLTNVTDPCWTGNFTDSQSGSVCANPNDHLFWDDLHPTAVVQSIVATDALKALAVSEPASASLFLIGLIGVFLAHVMTRVGRIQV
ncbi:fatty acyltransferase-like protein [Candidatus Nitrosoglobus terrae]|uniref:Fatty acyltransferase-like protein n=1 Tax=Candidatus Nitrosoglobus terrae TaxID=1630141 RepID=A0A1Q2SPR0_9GAMM|nr:SGNH/GDSL hydrolase family protein [Candidatus Nitrosoglobus terrae]BAW81112.1 fatty acyltransferase-like protein [Candidatus Nitrosoglobus terrae]